MTGVRGSAVHCSICGAKHRNKNTHREGMTRAQHEKGAIDLTRPPQSAEERETSLNLRQSWVGRVVTFPDQTRWKVDRHINGSLYQVKQGDKVRFASHSSHNSDWAWWEDRPGSRSAAERVETEEACEQYTKDAERLSPSERMDDGVKDLIAQEDEAATMAPPTEDSDTLRIEMLGGRLEYEDGHLFVVFKVGPEYFSGRLDKYVTPDFDPLDLIRKEDD